MSGTDMLNFEGDATWKAQQQGRDDAQALFAGNSAYDLKDAFYEWIEDKTLQEEFPMIGDYLIALDGQAAAEDFVMGMFEDMVDIYQ